MNTKESLRLSFRVVDNYWNAYIARTGTMEDAVLIGSIAMSMVQDQERKQQFMQLMQDCMEFALHSEGIKIVAWNEPTRAPKHERSSED